MRVRCRRKKFTFAISSSDEFLVLGALHEIISDMHSTFYIFTYIQGALQQVTAMGSLTFPCACSYDNDSINLFNRCKNLIFVNLVGLYICVCVRLFVSDTSSVSCNFDDPNICGYRDLSEPGRNWLQIRNSGELTSKCMYKAVAVYRTMTTSTKMMMITHDQQKG